MVDAESNLPEPEKSGVTEEAAKVKEALKADETTGLPVNPEKVADNKATFGVLAERLKGALAKKDQAAKPQPVTPPAEPPKPAGGA